MLHLELKFGKIPLSTLFMHILILFLIANLSKYLSPRRSGTLNILCVSSLLGVRNHKGVVSSRIVDWVIIIWRGSRVGYARLYARNCDGC